MIKYLFLCIIDTVFTLLCYLLNPIVVLFANKEGYLPRPLSWFGTHDNSLDGDSGWKEKLPWITNTYLRRVLWLYRNAGYSFSYNICGYDLINENIVIKGDKTIRNRPSPAKSGYCIAWDKSKNIFVRGWMIYLVYGYGNRCIRLYLGWKFMGFETGRKMLAFHFNPFMGYDK